MVPSVLFDEANTTSNHAWLQHTPPPGSGVITWEGNAPPGGVMAKDIGIVGLFTVCGRLEGGTSIEVEESHLNFGCDPQGYIFDPSDIITWPDEVLYSGVINKQPPNCGGQNGIVNANVTLTEHLNNDLNDPMTPRITDLTDGLGHYDLPGTLFNPLFALQGQCYEICPTKGDPGCDLNISDMDLIQDWINGTKCITEHWELLAGDMNNDNLISVADLVVFQRILLGTFDYGSSYWSYWKFIRSTQYNSTSLPPCPLDVPVYDICFPAQEFVASKSHGWYGVITGDTDGNCGVCDLNGGSSTRSSLITSVNCDVLESESKVEIVIETPFGIKAANQSINLSYPSDVLEFEKIICLVDDGNEFIVENSEEKGVIKYFWTNLWEQDDYHGRVKLTFNKLNNTKLKESDITLVDGEMLNHVSDFDGNEYSVELKVNIRSHTISVIPNPSNGMLRFEGIDDFPIILKVFNQNGQVVFTRTIDNPNVNLREYLDSGLYILEFQSSGFKSTSKLMIQK